MAEFAHFCLNSVIATFALVAKLCDIHICNRFEPGEFGASSIFRTVLTSEKNDHDNLNIAEPLLVLVCFSV